MLLSDLVKKIDCVKVQIIKKKQHYNKISTTSLKLDNKTIFIIDSQKKIKKKYLEQAITKDIPALICNKIYKKVPINQFVVKNIKKEKEKLLRDIKPNKPIKTIAITGTNGKTSVAWYVSEICKINKINIKMQGTLGFYINGKKAKNENLTTPDYETLYQNSYSKKKNKFNFIFEASSHSLSQNRFCDYPIDIACITNITHDHLDYHKSIANYRNAKYKLFKEKLSNNGIAIINSRISNLVELKRILKKRKIKNIIYGEKDIYFYYIKNKLYLNIFKKKYSFKGIKLTEIEKQNIECAIACCLQLNLKPNSIISCIRKLNSPPGRSETIICKKKCNTIIVDYAHTPDALKNILLANTLYKKKPSLIFGCGGNRDKLKRRKMAEIADKFAKSIYVTDDNPRNENPQSIRSSILRFCPRAIEIPNRKRAIYEGINKLKKNDILIIAGKGHEKNQILKNKIIKFDDFKIAKHILDN